MISKFQFLFALLLTTMAVLYQIEVDTKKMASSEMGRISANKDKVARFISNPDNAEKWVIGAHYVKAADSRPLGVGKKFHMVFAIPFLGNYVMMFKVTEYLPNQLIVLESEHFVKPKFSIKLIEEQKEMTQIILGLEYKRRSSLFQWTVGPPLWFITKQQLQRSIFFLKMLFPF